jgi:hypothetical protein
MRTNAWHTGVNTIDIDEIVYYRSLSCFISVGTSTLSTNTSAQIMSRCIMTSSQPVYIQKVNVYKHETNVPGRTCAMVTVNHWLRSEHVHVKCVHHTNCNYMSSVYITRVQHRRSRHYVVYNTHPLCIIHSGCVIYTTYCVLYIMVVYYT